MLQPRKIRMGAAIACGLVLALCQLMGFPARSQPAGVPAGIPAVIVHPSAASRSELSRVIRHAFGGSPVRLADDALTTTNILSLEHANPRDPAGRPLNGRELSHPQTFQLFKRGSRCVLVRTSNGDAWTLRHARCAALPSEPSRPESPAE
jgi:hypothetical protein